MVMRLLALALVGALSAAVNAQDIVTVANSAGLTTLVSVVQQADLVGPLTDGAANLTVLAPTNAAFTALGTKTLDTVTKTYNKDWLQKILLYHVLGNRFPSSVVLTLVGSNTPATLEGSTIPVTKVGSDLYLGPAKVITPDVTFFNGNRRSVVHVIDKVLVPPTLTLPGTIVDLVLALEAQGEFTILLKALTEFGTTFTDILSSFTDKGYTVFAPTDAAFKALPARYRTFPIKNKACKQRLAKILKYHVVPRFFLAASLTNGKMVNTLAGEQIEVKKKMGGVFVDGAKVVTADVRAANGVIHVVNKVLMP